MPSDRMRFCSIPLSLSLFLFVCVCVYLSYVYYDASFTTSCTHNLSKGHPNIGRQISLLMKIALHIFVFNPIRYFAPPFQGECQFCHACQQTFEAQGVMLVCDCGRYSANCLQCLMSVREVPMWHVFSQRVTNDENKPPTEVRSNINGLYNRVHNSPFPFTPCSSFAVCHCDPQIKQQQAKHTIFPRNTHINKCFSIFNAVQ